MSSEAPLTADLLDLKLLPAWLKESPEAKQYEHYTGEEDRHFERGRERRKRPTGRRDTTARQAPKDDRRPAGRNRAEPEGRKARRAPHGRKDDRHRPDRHRQERPRQDRQPQPAPKPPDITIRFLPRTPVLANVVEQIKSGAVAYSLFHLARLFLDKPERYEVRLAAKPESPLFQLGENGALSLNRQFLEQNAFGFARDDFYKIDITQGEPIKGNFTSVARDRLSGTLLGPTNYHSYQPRLRTLYEQRFSKRMSFSDYQRQIEIVNDPALIERWKEEAQKVTTYTTLREETPVTFSSAAEAERHFRSTYLPSLVRSVEEVAIGGVQSRRLPDRVLNRAIEDAWSREIRSPSVIMQELATRFRQDGLHVFRHRKGMLFVSPLRVRTLRHEEKTVSAQVRAILETVASNPGMNRKELADKLIVDPSTPPKTNVPPEEIEPSKLALASNLHWLISEGYVIEFNDGSLDLPREKSKPKETKEEKDAVAAGATTEPNKPVDEAPNSKLQAPEKSPISKEGAEEESAPIRQEESAVPVIDSEAAIGGS